MSDADTPPAAAWHDVVPPEEASFRSVIESATDAVVLADHRGVITFWNPAAERTFGYSAREALGMSLTALMPERLRAAHQSGLDRMSGGGEPRLPREPITVTGQRRDGAEFALELTLSTWSTGAGMRYGGIMRDVSAREAAGEESRRREERFRALSTNAPVGIFEADADGRCLFVNRRMCEISGLDEAASLDFGWVQVVHEDDRARVRAAWEALVAGRERFQMDFRLLAAEGVTRWVAVAAAPLLDDRGDAGGFIGTLTDMTEHRRAERELDEARERLAATFDAAPIGMGTVGVSGAWLDVNPALCRLLGYRREELLETTFQSITHPDDLEADLALLGETLAGSRDGYTLEKRYLHAQGHVVWVNLSVALVRDAGGGPRYLIAQVEDITERRRVEQELHGQQMDIMAIAAVARDLGDGLDALASICSTAGQVLEADGARLMRLEDRTLRVVAHWGRRIDGDEVIPAGQRSAAQICALSKERQFFADGRDHPAVNQRLLRLIGATSLVFEPVMRGREILGVLLVHWTRPHPRISTRDATALRLLAAEAATALERRDLVARLRDAARTDPLTGVANRRAWDERLSTELASARRRHEPLSVAVLDVDDFKRFNDTLGHQAGDELLQRLTYTWAGALREDDLLARLGGDEFGVLMPGCSLEPATVIVRRLCGSEPVSAGVAQWDGEEPVADTVTRADEALYRDKRTRSAALTS